MKKILENKRNVLNVAMLLILMIWAWTICSSVANEVVISDYNVINAIRMEKFVHRFDKKHSDRLFFIQTTIEGGYVLSDLYVSKNDITFTIDSSRDAYSNQSTQSIVCKNIKREIHKFNIVYSLNQCDQFPKDQDILIIGLGMK
ncbi:DUF4362 domain-containing protein [Paenibacillus sp. N3.4]|uniref:DUF4362 domain-containing protein n=1 Tax=Paenibacillus sp. N3.4 TaxID=2603222 RepID=UPI0011CA7E8C|nr:DUF4362 domain-containing protein [Paenibacillus sp. N3.4]TXK78382.1 DUF4362 domain-containing protein [Paenibacillus sp. N3.4]